MDDAVLQLRATFDDVAERYDVARPRYPRQTVEDLLALAPAHDVLEIGAGTGILTVPLAERGLAVTAVELGSALADVARRNLAAFPDTRVVVGTFEDAPLADAAFDLVVAATSFHWLDPAVRLAKSARVLRPGGALAVIHNEHVAGGTEQFFADAQACYERWDPATPPGLRLQAAETFPVESPALVSPLFAPAVLRRYAWDITYSTREYLALLLTYSGHLALPPAQQTGLLRCIGDLIDGTYGGTVTKRYLTELRVAARIDR